VRVGDYGAELARIDDGLDDLLRRVERWAGIASGTRDLPGLAAMADEVSAAFAPLGGEVARRAVEPHEEIDGRGELVRRPLGAAVSVVARPRAPLRALLAAHMDTVFGREDDGFRAPARAGANRLRGAGVIDAKGGIAVMLEALRALERSPAAGRLGWEVLVNADEEIGSPGSTPLLVAAAGRAHLGLVFEPALAGGALAGARKGSGSFTLVVRGRSAHAGRDFGAGRSAVRALAGAVVALEALNGTAEGLTVNVGSIEGGRAVNVVPALAIARINVRVADDRQREAAERAVRRIVDELGRQDGIAASLHGGFTAPPKPLDAPTRALLGHVRACGRALGLELEHRPTGGVCDGNRLAAAGLPTVDTLGPRGGDIHSPEEYLEIDSLAERAKLAALLLLRLADGSLPWPPRAGGAR
jgi:glutamate carboxypeptidase